MEMRRTVLVLLLAAGGVLLRPASLVQATDINENPECQQMFQRLAQPYFDQMQWFGSVATQYPLAPNGRPIMTGWPYSGYGPGNGYGPGSPYGPNFGPWGALSFGPGFGGPGGYGITPDGFGSPVYQGAGAYAAQATASLAAYPAGTGALGVANSLAANPGIAGLAPADLVALGGLRQSLIGNVQGAIGIQQAMIGNRISDAALRQGVIANRFSAYSANSDLASFPYARLNDLSNAIQGVSTYVQNMCPAPSDRGD
jgi:hypothetical protein